MYSICFEYFMPILLEFLCEFSMSSSNLTFCFVSVLFTYKKNSRNAVRKFLKHFVFVYFFYAEATLE